MNTPNSAIPQASAGQQLPSTEVLLAGELSAPERIRGRALAVAQGTISDAELMGWYLEERAFTPATRASYGANLRRLDWFARKHMGLGSLRELQREDWDRLKAYLMAPPEADKMHRSVGVESPDWRPFRAALSPASAAQALGVIQSFMGWLAEPAIGALRYSPFASLKVPRPKTTVTGKAIERYLPNTALRHLFEGLDALPGSDLLGQRRRERLKFLTSLALMSGLRASEIAAARSSMLRPAPEGGWSLHIQRKGGIASKLPISDALLRRWRLYRDLLGCSQDHDMPLIGHLDDKPTCAAHSKALTRQTIWELFNEACRRATANAEAAGDDHSAAILSRASTHWARHTFGVQLLDSGSDLRSARELLEHASLNTTTIYTHIGSDQRRSDLERMTQGLDRMG